MNLKIRFTFARRSAGIEDQGETISLDWNLNRTSIALKYYKALQIAAETGYMYRRDRFYNFPRSFYTEDVVVDRLNKSIETINRYHPGLIQDKAYKGMSQEYMNHMHTNFEIKRGALLNPTPIYANGNAELREAFDDLNIFIHRYEDSGFSGRRLGTDIPKFYATFGISEKVRRYPMDDEDFQHFTFEQTFGALIINYCEVGKPLHDVWRDNDHEIGHEAILPLRYYSADSMIYLSKGVSKQEAEKTSEKFYNWWDENSARLSELGFTKGDPRNAVGQLPVAELDRSHPLIRYRSEMDIVELLSNYQWLQKVECISQPGLR